MDDGIIGVILAISLVLVLSPHFSRLIGLPTAPIEIILGSCLALGGIIDVSNNIFFLIAHVGFLYLMFLAGLEVNIKSIFKMPREYIIQSLYFLLLMWILALLFGFIFNLNPILIMILPLISIGILATLSKEYGKEVGWIKLSFLVGTIGEVLSIMALTIFEASSHVNSLDELFAKIGLLLLFLLVVWILYFLFKMLFWWYPELKTILMPSSRVSDGKYQDVRLAMGIFFIMIAIMLKLHLEVAFGSFIAGVFIATFFHGQDALEEKIASFGFGFLVPIFFVYVGASFDLKNILILEVLQITMVLLFVMFTIRILAAFILTSITERKEALLIAFALSMPLTLMIAMATIAYESSRIVKFEYYAVILASLLEVIISMVVIKKLAQ